MKRFVRMIALILALSLTAWLPVAIAEAGTEKNHLDDDQSLLEAGDFESGDSGEAVLVLQRQLQALGYLEDEPTGIMDDATQDALESFRKDHSPAAGATYIGNQNSKKFHAPDCDSVREMKESNKVRFDTREEALEAGYVPCKRCNP